ncbi:MAG: hypothetical protein U1E55_00705 [Paracoccus sp. (in: a-proteobacteria)]|jgi:hypothetical protein|uniref:hypothetical protein n=1 Tax=Paracoccus sp. TaxID=267 RepID=UPI0035B1365E
MQRSVRAAIILAIATSIAMPALADQGRGHDRDKRPRKEHHAKEGRGKHHAEHRERRRESRRDRDDDRDWDRDWDRVYVQGCPPGLAKKHNGCQPPGHARKHYRRGDVLYGDYYRVRDYDRYRLERRDNWDYYRDDDRIYRVDSNTRKILAVINLIDAFSN